MEYAIEAYEFSVFRYIPKNRIEEKLSAALEDFYKLDHLERNEFYTIQVKNNIKQIAYRDILYILKDGKYAVRTRHFQNKRGAAIMTAPWKCQPVPLAFPSRLLADRFFWNQQSVLHTTAR